jgi:anti-sigma factor RsiW
MARWRRTTACERAVQWISLELDGEIAALEGAALARHLQRCDDCRSSRAQIGAFTRALRASPADGPEWPVAIAVPQRGKRFARAGVAAFVTMVAVMGALAVFPTSNTPTASTLGFLNLQEQREFVREHVNMEPTLFLVAPPVTNASAAPPLR